MSYNHVTIKIVRKYETAQYCKRCIRVSKSILYIENTFFFYLFTRAVICLPANYNPLLGWIRTNFYSRNFVFACIEDHISKK